MTTPGQAEIPAPAAEPLRFCPRCGQYLGDRDGARFCCRCGLAQMVLAIAPESAKTLRAGVPNPERPGLGAPARVPPLSVAGFQYYHGPLNWDRLTVGDRIELVPEPHNRYDPWAVRVQWQGVKIGYVPRQVSEEVSRLLRAGRDLKPVLCEKSPRRPFGYHSLRFQVDLPLGYQLWKWPM